MVFVLMFGIAAPAATAEIQHQTKRELREVGGVFINCMNRHFNQRAECE
jgi:hypothetical protein